MQWRHTTTLRLFVLPTYNLSLAKTTQIYMRNQWLILLLSSGLKLQTLYFVIIFSSNLMKRIYVINCSLHLQVIGLGFGYISNCNNNVVALCSKTWFEDMIRGNSTPYAATCNCRSQSICTLLIRRESFQDLRRELVGLFLHKTQSLQNRCYWK